MTGGDISIGSGGGEIAVCDITLKRSRTKIKSIAHGTLKLNIVDERGKQVPARVGIYDATGRMPRPSRDAIQTAYAHRAFTQHPGDLPWTETNRRAFYSDGNYHAKLPAGNYDIVVARGPEYHILQDSFVIAGDKETVLDLMLSRWTNMSAKGWYSGDTHIHYSRANDEDSKAIHLLTQAEDLNVGNLLQMDNIGAVYYRQYNWGKDAHYGNAPYRLVPGQEGPRTLLRGHTIQLNIDEPAWNPERYFLYHEVFEKTHRQGGLTGYAHVGLSNNLGLLRDNLGALPGLALDVPYGLVDFVEVLQFANADTEIWFNFLNLGYKLSPAAGTDYPSLGIPGAVRNYVKITGEYSVQKWFDGLKAGRTFVTNGPMLEFSINGKGMGSEVPVKRGALLAIEAKAMINPDIDRLNRIELIQHGKVVAEVKSQKGSEILSLKHELRVDEGSWFILRAHGKQEMAGQTIVALSAPIYVTVDGQGFCKISAIPSIVAMLKGQMEKILETPVERQPVLSQADTWGPRLKYWEDNRIHLQRRIDEVNKKYMNLINRSAEGHCVSDQ